MWSKRPDCRHLITGQSIVNQRPHGGRPHCPSTELHFGRLLQWAAAQDALMKTFPCSPCFSSLCSIPFSENAFYKCRAVHRVNALIMCLAQNTGILMKALNCKRKFKPITTEWQFHNTGSWHGAWAGNTARLVDWKVPSAIWKVSLHLQESQKEKNSLLGVLYSFFSLVTAFGIESETTKLHSVFLKETHRVKMLSESAGGSNKSHVLINTSSSHSFQYRAYNYHVIPPHTTLPP